MPNDPLPYASGRNWDRVNQVYAHMKTFQRQGTTTTRQLLDRIEYLEQRIRILEERLDISPPAPPPAVSDDPVAALAQAGSGPAAIPRADEVAVTALNEMAPPPDAAAALYTVLEPTAGTNPVESLPAEVLAEGTAEPVTLSPAPAGLSPTPTGLVAPPAVPEFPPAADLPMPPGVSLDDPPRGSPPSD